MRLAVSLGARPRGATGRRAVSTELPTAERPRASNRTGGIEAPRPALGARGGSMPSSGTRGKGGKEEHQVAADQLRWRANGME